MSAVTGTTPSERLTALGLRLPELRRPSGNYVGYVRTGDLLFLSGQGAEGFRGRIGAEMSLEQGAEAAQACMLNLLAQTADAAGSIDRVRRIVKVLGFVACTEQFRALPAVINGGSELLLALYGEDGRHARAAIGAQSLPLGFAVEIEMIVELTPGVPA